MVVPAIWVRDVAHVIDHIQGLCKYIDFIAPLSPLPPCRSLSTAVWNHTSFILFCLNEGSTC